MRFATRSANTTWGMDSDRADDWRERGACRNHDPELFFNDTKGPMAQAAADLAKTICRRCTVRRQCLLWIGENPQEFGIFAGLTAAERRGRKWCGGCGERFAYDPGRPLALLCTACAVQRERFGDPQDLIAERFGTQERTTA